MHSTVKAVDETDESKPFGGNKIMNILFLCTGNSARSILGEVIFNTLFSKQGKAFSAGSHPVGAINPMALTILKKHGHETHALSSKNMNEFTGDDAPLIDILISVCDNAAQDCPVWLLGETPPKHIHWPLPDPASVEGESKKEQAFEDTYQILKDKLFVLIPSL